MNKKKSRVFQLVICVFIAAVTLLTAVLNANAYIKSCVEAAAENNAVILSSITSRIEYGLKYGRELDNYYDIDEISDRISRYCRTEHFYITDTDLTLLYGETPPGDIGSMTGQMYLSGDDRIMRVEGDAQQILLAISGKEDTAGYIGISYPVESVKGISDEYVRLIYLFALLEGIAGIIIFEILFRRVRHNNRENRLKNLVMTTIIAVNIISVIPMYFILHAGYEALSGDVASDLIEHSADDVDRLLNSGIYYSDMKDTDAYFSEIAESSEQISEISLTELSSEQSYAVIRELSADGRGERRYLTADISADYVQGKVNSSIISVAVTTVTAVMIAVEILIFLSALLVGEAKDRRKKQINREHRTIEKYGIVRGLSFFFAGFRYMSVAFMSIVLAEIYKPVVIFGWEIPFEILMSLPLSAQVFISMITSYLSGVIINRRGWKNATLAGIAVMIFGTLASALAEEPIPFILAQMLMGTGLGFAKMGIDIYAVVVSSEKDMPDYTSGSNAGIIVGFSCSAAIGAMFASIFGYSGAYIVMTFIGAAVLFLIYFFGMDVSPEADTGETENGKADNEENGETTVVPGRKTGSLDLRFPVYILFVIIPYFFIMMFVDYFFPVYANSEGIATDVIGYVMLIYGIVTAYIGTPLCPRLTKKFSASLLMPVILLILAAFFFVFAMYNFVLMAVLIVVLIGIADGIMPSIQFMYVYELPFSKRVGFSKAIGIEGFFSSMIGAAAPVIFGVVMLYGNGGLAVVAVLVAAGALLFAFLNGIESKKRIED